MCKFNVTYLDLASGKTGNLVVVIPEGMCEIARAERAAVRRLENQGIEADIASVESVFSL